MATNKDFGGGGDDRTVIGQSILINGRLTGDEDLTVQGRVEGELALSKTLIVEPSGIVKAEVTVRNAVVSGVVVGNINATESVELTREGRMVGDIRAPRVIIVEGASFRGRIDMGEGEPGRAAAPRPAARPVPAAPARPTMTASAPARPAAPPPPAPPRPAAGSADLRAKTESRPAPPPPPAKAAAPAAPAVAAGGKKKVVVTKKR